MEREQLSWPELILISEFEAHGESIDLVERGLRENLLRKAEKIREIARAAGDGEEYDELMSEVYEYEQDSEGGQLMTIVFNSFFVASFALFEHKLWSICRRAHRDAGHTSRLKLNNSVSSAKSYLLALGIDSPFGGEEWRVVKICRQIRNRIVHHGATISNDQCLQCYAKRKRIVSGAEGKFRMTREYCDEALENFTQFILKTHRAYSNWSEARSRAAKS